MLPSQAAASILLPLPPVLPALAELDSVQGQMHDLVNEHVHAPHALHMCIRCQGPARATATHGSLYCSTPAATETVTAGSSKDALACRTSLSMKVLQEA